VTLITGLGNPGPAYKKTRHNAGYQTIDFWCRQLNLQLRRNQRFQSLFARTAFQGEKIMLLCPLTYMNRSGMAVRACVQYFGLDTENLLVIHDDLDLPLGRVKVARSGGPGGHKGVASIIDHLGTRKFPRIKIGIGRPLHGEAMEDFVLSPFYKDQRDIMETALQWAVKGCELFLSKGIEAAMTQVNCQNSIHSKSK